MNNVAQTTNDIKNGSVLNLDGQLWTVMKFQHVKPGKGPAFVRTTIKNVLSGKIVDKTIKQYGFTIAAEVLDNIKATGYKYSRPWTTALSSTPTRTVTTSCSWT